jgi:type VI secretion system protein VasD
MKDKAMLFNLSISTIRSACEKRRLFAATVVALLICGCSSTPKPVTPTPFSVSIQTDKKVNPDNYGRPSPIKVVFYELKSPVAFETADFFSLSQKDQATLGADMLGKEELFLGPGETKTLTRKGIAETTALGVFVEFRDIDKSIWHATSTFAPAEPTGIMSTFKSAPQRSYQITIDQHSVKFVPTGTTSSPALVPDAIQNIPGSLPAVPTLTH